MSDLEAMTVLSSQVTQSAEFNGTFPARHERADVLSYLAEMLDGLQGLARQSGSETLVGLLRLAHAEAVLEQRRAHPRAD